MAGFLGLTMAGFGARGCLVAAWEGPEHPRQLLRSPAHAAPVPRFSRPDFVASEMSSVWTSVYLRWRVRCPACGRTAAGRPHVCHAQVLAERVGAPTASAP